MRNNSALVLCGLLACLTVAPASARAETPAVPAASDPVMVYDGAWTVTPAKSPPVHLRNRCFQGQAFVVCEQALNGKVLALLTFRLVDSGPSGRDYMTLPIQVGLEAPKPTPLHIDGDHWTYTFDEIESGKKTKGRVLNTFKDRDHLHYEIQSSADGKVWSTTASGDEVRDR